MLLLDTSVIVPFYVPEAASGRVQRLFSSGTPLAISPLGEVEFHSAISRLVRMKSISPDAGKRVIAAFASHVRQKLYSFRPITRKQYDLARDWIGELTTSLRTLDALQLATAHANGLPLATADRVLAKAAKRLGVKCKLFS